MTTKNFTVVKHDGLRRVVAPLGAARPRALTGGGGGGRRRRHYVFTDFHVAAPGPLRAMRRLGDGSDRRPAPAKAAASSDKESILARGAMADLQLIFGE